MSPSESVVGLRSSSSQKQGHFFNWELRLAHVYSDQPISASKLAATSAPLVSVSIPNRSRTVVRIPVYQASLSSLHPEPSSNMRCEAWYTRVRVCRRNIRGLTSEKHYIYQARVPTMLWSIRCDQDPLRQILRDLSNEEWCQIEVKAL